MEPLLIALALAGGACAGVLLEHGRRRGRIGDAERVARRRFGPPPYDDHTARRVVGFLARRGFDPDAVAAVVGRPSLD